MKQELINYALASHSYGFVPVPVRDKIPVMPKWSDFRNDPAGDTSDIAAGRLPIAIRRFEHLYKPKGVNNISILTGEASGGSCIRYR